MSDSDSDDGFTCLITNGEENFWKTYQSAPKVEKSPDVFKLHAATASTSSSYPQPSKANNENTTIKPKARTLDLFKPQTSTSQLKRRQLESDSSDSADEHNKSTRRKNTKKRRSISSSSSSSGDEEDAKSKKKGAKEGPPSNNLLSAILKTLSKPTQAAPIIDSPTPVPQVTQPILQQLLEESATSPTTVANILISNQNHIPTTSIEWGSRGVREKTRVQPKRGRNIPQPQHLSTLDAVIDSIVGAPAPAAPVLEDPSKTPRQETRTDRNLNRVIDVKILWKSVYLKIFKIRRFSPLKLIVEHFAVKENVNPNHICFSINDRMINLSLHSCVTLKYEPHQEIEGGILDCDDLQTQIFSKEDKGIKLKVRLVRRTEIIAMEKDIGLDYLYAQVVLKFGVTFGQFKLEFDGSIISCSETVRDIGLEEDDYIDVLL